MGAFAKPVHWVLTKTSARPSSVQIVHRDLIQIRRATLIVLRVHPVNNAVVHGANMVDKALLVKTVPRDILRPAA